MNEMEKYLAALEAAVEASDKKAFELLEDFATHVYHRISEMCDDASGEDRAVWDAMRKRAQAVIVGFAQSAPDIWL